VAVCDRRGSARLVFMFMFSSTKPYRSRGLGSQSLQQIIDAAKSHGKLKIDKIYLHIQTSNSDAKRFYEKHGFEEVGIHENYYKRIELRDAFILLFSI
jgi:N-alpha-acetyltransferase 50